MADERFLEAFNNNDHQSWQWLIKENLDVAVIDLTNSQITFPHTITNFKANLPFDFSGSTFVERPFHFAQHNFGFGVDISNCIFNVALEISGSFSVKAHKSTFNGPVKLIDRIEVDFKESTFNEELKILNGEYRKICLDKTTLNKALHISPTVRFDEEFQMREAEVNEHIIASKVTFRKGADLTKTEIHGQVSLNSTVFESYTYFSNTIFNFAPNFHNANLYEGTDFTGAIFKDVVSKSAYSNYKTLKNKMNKFQAYYEANKFYGLEQASLLEKIKWTKGNIWNTILLILNKWSNNFNQSWSRGVLFTFLVGVLFYVTYLSLQMELWYRGAILEDIAHQMRFFWAFIIPTHRLDFAGFQPNILGGFIDFLGRVFIGYGLYQTIQAFRKFGKK